MYQCINFLIIFVYTELNSLLIFVEYVILNRVSVGREKVLMQELLRREEKEW